MTRYKTIIILFLFLGLFPTIASAQRVIASGKDVREKNFYLLAGLPAALHSPEFFELYDTHLAGMKNRFSPSINIGAGTRFEIADRIKMGLAGNFFIATLKDSYEQKVTDPEPGTRNIAQDMHVHNIPLILSLEYIPYDAQFRTYFGGGGGICFGKIEWSEVVSSDIRRDPRKGGEHYSENNVYPAIRFFTGVELGFDKLRRDVMLGSLLIELRYNHIFRSVDLFRRVKNQFDPAPPALAKPVELITDFIEINMAVSLNFNTKLSETSKQ